MVHSYSANKELVLTEYVCPVIFSLALGHTSQNPLIQALLFIGQFTTLGIEKLF